jgi:exonuclease SbcC
MNSIVIRQMRLLNFKGIKNLEVNFDEHETSIFGANASGKTTIFDAFTWLLFGKDSSDRKDFNIKTLGTDGKPIMKLPHEVSATLDVNGDEITLRRCFVENWVKKRGSSVETFEGHTEERYWNDVPCSATEYKKKIETICPEDIFKLITNPLYFPSTKKESQRNMLFQMVGNITNEDVAATDPKKFKALMEQLTHKTIDEYKREIAAKKRRIKDDIESIPARIDERKRDIPEEENWADLEARIEENKKAIKNVDAQVADRTKSYNEASEQKAKIAKQLSDVKTELNNRKYQIKDNMMDEYRKQLSVYNEAVRKVNDSNSANLNEKRSLRYDSQRLIDENKTLNQNLIELTSRRDKLIEEWKSIKANMLVFDDNQFVCPTCHRPFDLIDIEDKKAEMTANFNKHQSELLEDNKQQGLSVKKQLENINAHIESNNELIRKFQDKIDSIPGPKQVTAVSPIEPNVEEALISDTKCTELYNKCVDLQNQLDSEIQVPDVSDLDDARSKYLEDIDSLKSHLSNRDKIKVSNDRIAELEKQLRKESEELTELDGIEFNIAEFAKAKIEQVESRINGMFKIVRFKMYEQQINGGEIETCECMINGVPFSDLNSAGKINAGLDIINAICKANEVHAPIFIDNRESVSDIIDVDSQIINLIVDASCKTIKVE